MNKYAFYHDHDRCIKCYACEVACKQVHDIKAGTVKYRRVEETTYGTFPDVHRTFLSVACMHCARPACIAACPPGIIHKREEDGIVTVDTEGCTGCRACYEACPVKAPQFIADGTMRKCDMCRDRVEKGEAPVCVTTCPTRALRWGTAEEILPLLIKKGSQKKV